MKASQLLTDAQVKALRELDTEHYKFMRYPAMAMRLEARGYIEGDLRLHHINYANGEQHWKRAYRLTTKGKESLQ